MATVLVGKDARVVAIGNTVGEMGTWTLSGFTREALDATAFGDDVKEYVFGVADAGELTFSGFYNPGDTNGQVLIESACVNASVFTGGDLKLYYVSNKYLTVLSGGGILITKCRAISMEKSGLGTVEFTAKISGGRMVTYSD